MLIAGADAYKKQYKLNIIQLIIFNLYGPRDNFDLETSHVIPALIRKCLENDKLIVWGDGSPTQSFLFVEDAARAVVLTTKNYHESYPVDISSPEEIRVKNLVNLIIELTNFKGKIEFDSTKPNGQPRRCADVKLAKKKFNFTSHYSIREGLMKTVNWYKLNKE